MDLLTIGGDSEALRPWVEALSALAVRHPNPASSATVTLIDGNPPRLTLLVENAHDTKTGRIHQHNPLLISSVKLTYFPGVRLARQWFAAAWAGYLQHEALELVTMKETGLNPLDPHQEPYNENPWNRGLRDGLPSELTPATLRKALAVVMDLDWADVLVSLADGVVP